MPVHMLIIFPCFAHRQAHTLLTQTVVNKNKNISFFRTERKFLLIITQARWNKHPIIIIIICKTKNGPIYKNNGKDNFSCEIAVTSKINNIIFQRVVSNIKLVLVPWFLYRI